MEKIANIFKKVINFIKKNYQLILILLFALLVSFLVGYFKDEARKRDKEQLEILKNIQDTLVSYRNKEGMLIEKLTVLESSNYKYFTKLQTSDSTVKELQKVVEKYGKQMNKPGATAMVVERIIERDSTIIKDVDARMIDGLVYLKDTLQDKWIYNTYERKGSQSIWNVKVKDDLTAAIVTEENGKKYVEITNKSPYSQTKNVRVWQFDEEKKKSKSWGIGLQVGYGISHDDILKPKPFVGIGISKNLITF